MTRTDCETFEWTPLDRLFAQFYVRSQLIFHPNDVQGCETLLQQGLERLIHALPFLSREIVIQVDSDGVESITTRSRPWQDLLKVKHHAKPMRKALADVGKDWARMDTEFMPVSVSYRDVSHPCPVLAVQINIHPDGLLLAVATNHMVTDAKGHSIVIGCLADCCRLAQGDALDIRTGMADQDRGREMLIHQLPAKIVNREGSGYLACESLSSRATALAGVMKEAAATIDRAHFTIAAEHVAALKARCNEMLPRILAEGVDSTISDGRPWVSSSDVVTALMWYSVCRAKYPELFRASSINSVSPKDHGDVNFDDVISIGVTIDTRQRLSPTLPASYIGNGAIGVLASERLGVMAGTDVVPILCRAALAIRKRIAATTSDDIRSLLSYIQSEPKPVTVFPGEAKANCFISNWRQMDFYQADFGPQMGKPDYFRSLDGVADGMVHIMPRRSLVDESLPWEIKLCLKHETLLRLKEDKVFTTYLQPDMYWP
ncbi:hypothetical protein FE257_010761 [Aspergillus nanangensis]|uniref:Uncharacterized protein n=1 Tax=Aspergillus nanangensis TaxID=2582783 RepID=A0AAD4CVF6_ASPNN|nr:hypothetical protein FE257_010761 [Aspergillus nanangensis]